MTAELSDIYIGPSQPDRLQKKYDKLFDMLNEIASPEGLDVEFARQLLNNLSRSAAFNIRAMTEEEFHKFVSGLLFDSMQEYVRRSSDKERAAKQTQYVYGVIKDIFSFT